MVRLAMLLVVALPVSVAASVSISGISVTVPFFSPNGDGVQDLTGISFEVESNHETVYIWISVTDEDDNPVKTLAEAEAREPGAVYKLWDGTNSSGGPAPEGTYAFDIVAMANSDSDGPYSAAVVLDKTAPDFTTLIYPNPYVPGLPFADSLLTVEVTTVNSQPADWLSVWVENQEQCDTLCTTQLTQGDTVYTCFWDGREEDDGAYRLFVNVSDRAGNSNRASYSINLDLKGPTVAFTYPEKAWLDTVPKKAAGWVFDRNDVDSIGMRFSEEADYGPVNLLSGGDTLVWYVDWPADLQYEGTFDLECFARDSIGYETVKAFEVNVDMTPPDVPVLDVPDVVSTADITVKGTCSPNDSVTIYRIWQGAIVDSTKLVCPPAGQFERSFELGLGENLFYATAKDKAGNVSGPSDTVAVVYEERTGILVPEKLDPGAKIDVNLSKSAREVVLRIFSIDGYYINTKTWYPDDLYNEFEWDLRDADNEEVRNGLYLLVFEIAYTDGSQSIEKRVVVISR